MPAEPPAAYFDANVVLAYVSNEPARTVVVRELLKQGAEGKLRIFSSTLTLVEVAFGAQEKTDRALDAESESRIDSLWPAAGKPITLVEPSVTIMRRARGLIRDTMAAGRRLQAADAVHLATAQACNAMVLYTYEDSGRRGLWSELTGLDVDEPRVDQEPML